jgi:UDP-N-acetylglucosamine/UDP-N-acetylgalactosamine diphosphorylase
MLNQPPIFLGGLCGVVGPSRVGFGSVLSAGKVYRSEYGEGLLILGEDFPTGNKSYDPNRLGSIRRKVFNNIFYIANLIALWSWYKYVRTMLVTSNPLKARLIRVALDIIGSNIYERVRQMDHFRGLVGESLQKVRILADSSIGGEMVQEQLEFFEMWDSTKSLIKDFHLIQGDLQLRDRFCDGIAQSLTDGPTEYIMAIQSIEHSDANMGTQWLTSIVDDFMIRLREVMPKNLKNIA